MMVLKIVFLTCIIMVRETIHISEVNPQNVDQQHVCMHVTLSTAMQKDLQHCISRKRET